MDRIKGAGHVNNRFVSEDAATNRPPTEITAEWMNGVQEELTALATMNGDALDPAVNTQARDAIMNALETKAALASPTFTGTPSAPTAAPGTSTTQLSTTAFVAAALANLTTGEYTTRLPSGAPLPEQNIGPLWHDDYLSIMVWQSFTANGAAYVGYASVLIGGLMLDTQPTPRVGYVRSGVSNLSRTAYAALRGWAMHNGVMVDSGVWAAGTIAVADNPDGTTFRAYDLRGEFLRGFDDGRGADIGRVFGSNQNASYTHLGGQSDNEGFLQSVDTVNQTASYTMSSASKPLPISYDEYLEVGETTSSGNYQWAPGSNIFYPKWGRVRPRNVALLVGIKY